jgi:hypothetical protein
MGGYGKKFAKKAADRQSGGMGGPEVVSPGMYTQLQLGQGKLYFCDQKYNFAGQSEMQVNAYHRRQPLPLAQSIQVSDCSLA